MWVVPAERMKMRTPHVVPLSRQTVALLRRLQAITGHRPHLFPNHARPKSYMGKTTLNAALVRMGFEGELTPHGFRATASTILNEMGIRADVIERQLAHEHRNQVRASYNHAEYLPERTKMMQKWADTLAGLGKGAQVIPMQRRA
jgi:integrase